MISRSRSLREMRITFYRPCVLAKSDHLACDKFSKLQLSLTPLYRETRILLHAKWSNLQNTQRNCIKFSGMLGEDEIMIQEKFC